MLHLICPRCGATYTAYPYHMKLGQKQTCPSCSREYINEKLRGPRTALLVHCAVCGKEFYKARSSFKSSLDAPVYCSLACCTEGRRRGLTKSPKKGPETLTPEGHAVLVASAKRAVAARIAQGYRHSEETRAKLSKGTAKYLSTHETPHISKIEIMVRGELERLGVPFTHQYFVRDPMTGRYSACIDFYLPEDNIALEVNGTYWHADPRVYPTGRLNHMQLDVQERYAQKVAVVHSLGLQLREIWERDIRSDVINAVALVLGDVMPVS